MNGSAANNTTSSFVGGPETSNSYSIISLEDVDFSKIDLMGYGSSNNIIKQVEGEKMDIKPHKQLESSCWMPLTK